MICIDFSKQLEMDMTPYLTTIYRGLKHFRNLRSERSPAKYVAKADAEVSSWFL